MIFLLAYLYLHYVIFLPLVMHMHIKLMNLFGNWLIAELLFIIANRTLGSECI